MKVTTPYQSFETTRLILKPVTEADAAFLFQILNSPKWLQYIGDRKVYTEAAAAAYIKEKMTPQLDRLGYGNNVVLLKESLLPLGVCGLYHRPGLPVVDIGFAFLPQHEGQGYGYEAASRLLQAAKEVFGIEKVCAITTVANLTSQKLLVKLGLQFIKMISMEEDAEELMYYEKVL